MRAVFILQTRVESVLRSCIWLLYFMSSTVHPSDVFTALPSCCTCISPLKWISHNSRAAIVSVHLSCCYDYFPSWQCREQPCIIYFCYLSTFLITFNGASVIGSRKCLLNICCIRVSFLSSFLLFRFLRNIACGPLPFFYMNFYCVYPQHLWSVCQPFIWGCLRQPGTRRPRQIFCVDKWIIRHTGDEELAHCLTAVNGSWTPCV